MVEYELVLKKDDQVSARYPISSAGLVVGRSPEVDIVLPGGMVSRYHARIWIEDSVPMVEDTGSRNGIGVNGRRVLKSELKEGDELIVGDSRFIVVKHSRNVPSSIITYEKAGTLATAMLQNEDGSLPILYRAAQLLGTVFDLDDLLSQILGLIFEALPVNRGFILTMQSEDSDIEIHAQRFRNADASEGPPLSRTLIQHVFRQRSAMLTADAMDDSRFDSSKSVMRYAIHAAMCAPLIGRQAIVGAIYVDANADEQEFSNEDLEVLTAIACVVGVAVENARLYKETVAHERLVAIGQATAGVGHCVKNILTGILGGAQFVDMALDKQDFKYLEKGWPIMRRAIDRIEMLVLNMMAYSRETRVELAPTDVDALVQEVLDTVKARADRFRIALEFKPGPSGVAQADNRGIFRVLLNLATNALDACEEKGGTVTVRTYTKPDGCYIEIRDTGVGIPPEIMARLPEAFVTTKGSSGTGLGLACSYRIVREHGGDILIESKPGEGASFTVFLPAHSDHQTQLPDKVRSPKS
ncbi:MAG TPA: ATP-binding protein [Candidatus Hydrogenedentes bacterium]|nr:ATP-binding protein [Candidatus Hydrogenedentota bacterium]HPG65462.1 ATP-binding protein [Candidatus Hydrogenedentota bacterium]